ncbi:MAG TPA: hypothetical protein VHT91_45550 [Kofleriaceae bacterium]|nr:hypothetical protein [Kofleriaceae bacterium]
MLLVVGSLLAGGCLWPRDRDTVRSVLTEARPRLDAQRTVLGPVEIHGNEITLLDGGLKLVARVPDKDEAGGRAPVHVHVLAIPKDRATGRLDLCIVGTDFADAARALTEHALPPLISATQQQPVLDASHTWSDTSPGIPGHSAYLGRSYVRGDADGPVVSNLLDAGVLANLPELPRDGRMHLLKVVVEAKAGDWVRDLELDGDIKLETARPLKIPSSAPAMVVAFVVLDGEPDPQNDTGARREAHQRLAAHPKSLPDPTECPAKLMPASPWGRAMLGRAMVEGDPRHRDLQRARAVLPKACRLAEDDPACQAASQLLESLDQLPSAGPGGASRTGW